MCENCERMKARQVAQIRENIRKLATGDYSGIEDGFNPDWDDDQRLQYATEHLTVQCAALLAWLTDSVPSVVLGEIAGTLLGVEVAHLVEQEMQAQAIRDSAPFN